MGLLSTVTRLAKSPHGRKALDQARKLANDPRTRARIDDARHRLSGRGHTKPGDPQ